MKIFATYNIKGGVGKTSTAVNLAYLAARDGYRVLLWDLDPQAAASFLFRVRPRVKGGGQALIAGKRSIDDAIKATDFDNLDLLPADFTYRNLDLVLDAAQKSVPNKAALNKAALNKAVLKKAEPKKAEPKKSVLKKSGPEESGPEESGHGLAPLLAPLRAQYDVIFLDCPPGISLLSESVLDAADTVLVPLIPTTLSVRTLDQLTDFIAGLDGRRPQVLAFFSMVDRRKRLHREISEQLPASRTDFAGTAIPALSLIEQMSVRRAPVAAFAARSQAARYYRELWQEARKRGQLPDPADRP